MRNSKATYCFDLSLMLYTSDVVAWLMLLINPYSKEKTEGLFYAACFLFILATGFLVAALILKRIGGNDGQ
jgi:hypothetical protein